MPVDALNAYGAGSYNLGRSGTNTNAAASDEETEDSGYVRNDVEYNYKRNNVSAQSKEMSETDFYKILAAQYQYQDPDNPMNTAEMMSQMVQQEMISAIEKMTTVINDMNTTNLFSYATSMMGKKVTVLALEDDEDSEGDGSDSADGSKVKQITGTVTGVLMGTTPSVFVDGKQYELSQIMQVGEGVADKTEDQDQNQNQNQTGTDNKTDSQTSSDKVNTRMASAAATDKVGSEPADRTGREIVTDKSDVTGPGALI